jgi:EmrB/QacA subfamily drug resistance transporter
VTSQAPTRSERPTSHTFLSDVMSRRELVLTISGLLLTLFLASLNQSIVNTAIPRIVSELRGFEIYAWVTTSYMLTNTAVVPLSGKAGDIYGRRPLLVGATVYFVVTTALCGFAQDMPQLIVLRGFQGIGGGVLTSTSFAIIAELLAPAQRARINGLFTGVFSLSTIVGPILGGFLTDTVSWRGVFYVSIPFGLFALAVLWRFFPTLNRPRQRKPIDFGGAITIVIATVCLLLALSWGGREYEWTSPLILGLFSGAILVLAAFFWIELHAADPILPLAIFRNNIVAISTLGASAQSIGVFGAALFIPLFVQGVIGTSATVSGTVMAPMMLMMLASSIVGGQMIARTGRYKPFMLVGFALCMLGMFLLSSMGTEAQYAGIVGAMLVLGLGNGLTGPTVTIAAQNASKPGELGVVTSLLQFARSMGSTLGTAVFGSILSLRFLAETRTAIPSSLTFQMEDSIRDPQALLSPDAATALQLQLVEAFPGRPEAVGLVLEGIRTGLAGSLHWVFLTATFVLATAFVAGLFMREVPLRGRRSSSSP